MTAYPLWQRAVIGVTSTALRALFRAAGGFRTTGLEHIPSSGPAILAGNHLSWADPPALRCVITRPCWFLANDFLFQIRVLGPLLPVFGGFPVKRGGLDHRALHEAEQHLRDGDLLCIFPEGGTTLTGRLSPFEPGVGLVALRTGAPIVPFAIAGTERVLPMETMRPRYSRGGILIAFGSPIHPDEVAGESSRRLQVERLTARVHEAVASMLPTGLAPADPDGPRTVTRARSQPAA